MYVSHFWRLEFQNKDVSMLGSFEGYEGGTCSRHLSLTCRLSSSLCDFLHYLSSICVTVSKLPLFIRIQVILDSGPPSSPHVNLSDCTCSDPVPKSGHILRYWRLRLQRMNSKGYSSTHDSMSLCVSYIIFHDRFLTALIYQVKKVPF